LTLSFVVVTVRSTLVKRPPELVFYWVTYPRMILGHTHTRKQD